MVLVLVLVLVPGISTGKQQLAPACSLPEMVCTCVKASLGHLP
jgi:hypothetical protein